MKNRSQQQGFTLLELVFVLVLTGIIAIISTKILSTGLIAYTTSSDVLDADWQGNLALERMVRDMRAVRSPTDISTATSAQFTFVDTDGTTISYTKSASTLNRNSQVLADGVNSLAFSYFDKNGASTAVLSAIRYITISLNITRNNTNLTFVTSVYPRNLP